MSRLPLLNLARVTYLELLFSLRIPASIIFVFLLPALLLLVLASRFQDAPYVVPGLLALVTAFSTLQGVGQVATSMRRGIWGTFQVSLDPDWLYLAGVLASRVLRTLVVTTLLLLLAVAALGYRLEGSLALHFGLVLLGSVSFACLGLLLAYLPRSPMAAAQAMTAAVLVMTMVSGVFFPPQGVLRSVSFLSPMTFLVDLMRANAGGAPLALGDVALAVGVLAAWGVASGGMAYRIATRREEE
jgi:ABC-2 type transport system permease protein